MIDGIDLVCLDAFGTLFQLRGSLGEVYAERARVHGLPAPEGLADLLERRFHGEFGAMPRPAYRPGDRACNDRVDREWWRILVQRVFAGLGPMDFEAFFDDVYARFADAAVWRVYPEVPEALAALRRADLRLAIVSNFDARLTAVCAGLDLLPAVDAVLIAAEAGVAKPDAEIFQSAIRRFGVRPVQAVHVGDSWAEDAEGARAAGLAAVHLQRDDHDAPAERPPEVPVISDLSELPD
ncbi:MAG: HAD-IA family hydrolase, partial [Thioalkalivibrio sp.]|nr:HAD-IA family hydrolase [Thioalkalivibrio sp.]